MEKDIRKIVEEGYDSGEYATVFRSSDKLTGFESSFLSQLLALLPNNPKVLDFGCGTGVPFDKYLVSQGCDVVGIDISENHLTQARINVPQATFIKADFSNQEFDTSFDAIVSFYAIFHIPREEHEDLLVRMRELLNDQGRILITLGAHDDEAVVDEWCGSKMAWSSYDSATYKKLLEETGFRIIKSAFEGEPGDKEYHFWVLAQKN